MVEPVVKVEALTKSFAQARRSLLAPRKRLHAVKDVSVDISRGEAFGIIGESGCGKSTLARMLVGLHALIVAASYWGDGMPRRCQRRSVTG